MKGRERNSKNLDLPWHFFKVEHTISESWKNLGNNLGPFLLFLNDLSDLLLLLHCFDFPGLPSSFMLGSRLQASGRQLSSSRNMSSMRRSNILHGPVKHFPRKRNSFLCEYSGCWHSIQAVGMEVVFWCFPSLSPFSFKWCFPGNGRDGGTLSGGLPVRFLTVFPLSNLLFLS